LCSNKGVSDFKDVFYTINLLFFDWFLMWIVWMVVK
jgi:hypothetical protein